MNTEKLRMDYPSEIVVDMLCAPLYSDIASAAYGLYENKDTHLPYAIFVVSCSTNKTLITTSPRWISQIPNAQRIQEWHNEMHKSSGIDYVSELSLRTIHRHEPWVLTELFTNEDELLQIIQRYLPNNETVSFAHSKTWRILCNNPYSLLYVVALRDTSLASMPELTECACDRIIGSWQDYLDGWPNELAYPVHNVNSIFEEILCAKSIKYQKMLRWSSVITKISSLYYENGRGKGAIIFTATKNEFPFIKISMSEASTRLMLSMESAKQLRKLLETTKDALSLLVYDDEVYGIGKPENPVFSYHITGHMEWHLNECLIIDNMSGEYEEHQVLRYKHGDYYFPLVNEMKDWYITSRTRQLAGAPLEVIKGILDEKNIKKFSCGAVLILSADAKNEVNRLCIKKRGIATNEINILQNLAEASTLCSIDGAIFLDYNGNCHGIGIILDGEAKVDGTPARGARYNSTKTYLSRCYKEKITAFAVIISQDGYIDIISTYDKECQPIE